MSNRSRRLVPTVGLIGGGVLVASALASMSACSGTGEDGPMPCYDESCGEPQPVQQDESVFVSAVRPPPVTGGTLLVTHDQRYAIASDPDRDRIVVADLVNDVKPTVFQMADGSEPARSVEDAAHRVHVALRTTGQIVTVDLDTLTVSATTSVCPAPRGLAYDQAKDQLYVACEGGELVTLTAGSGAGARTQSPAVKTVQKLGDDLRDVVVSGNNLLVTRFRSASVLVVHPDGTNSESKPQNHVSAFGETFSPTVAWRMVSDNLGGFIMLHQHSKLDPIVLAPPGDPGDPGTTTGGGDIPPSDPGDGGYGGTSGCEQGIVHGAVTAFSAQGDVFSPPFAGTLAGMTVPVDLAVSPTGNKMAVVAAGSEMVIESAPTSVLNNDGCALNQPGALSFGSRFDPAVAISGDMRAFATSPEPIAVAYMADQSLVIQTREPSRIEIHDPANGQVTRTIDLGGASRLDSGHRLFHGNPELQSTGIACASCHPEGRDDGHVWNFTTVGARRTQSLRGFSSETAPFHWDGDQTDIAALMDDVFVRRMGGTLQTTERKEAIRTWLDSMPQPAVRTVTDAAAVERGKNLFESADVGCATCHGGNHLTNNTTVDVHTGGLFQVPSLVGIGGRSPFMHNGCAPSLRSRFTDTTCGGGDAHGHTSGLADGDIDDLVAYLETL